MKAFKHRTYYNGKHFLSTENDVQILYMKLDKVKT
jgi:hypothetical protein